jgi:hypothetical protein
LISPHVGYLAHHWLLLAGPAFLPAVIVVAVILYIAIKDRRSAGDDDKHTDELERRRRQNKQSLNGPPDGNLP